MNTVNIFKDEKGNIVGTTSNPNVGISISADSAEYLKYLENLNQSQISTWDQIRSQRNYLLSQTDWIFAPDVTLTNKEAWLTYRQALRDLPQSFEDPSEVIWPTKPE